MPATDRHVPGAPPPASTSKNQKKKRKGAAEPGADDASSVVIPDAKAAALVEKVPEPEDIQSGAIAPELIADTPIDEVKLSPIVDLIAKRLKAISKKIKRVNTYSSVDPLILDEDQKALLKSLPSLEAVQKELLEVRKAVESHEAELGGLLAAEKMRTFKAQQAQVSEAVTASLATSKQRTADVLNLVRLFNYLSQGDPAATSLNLNEQEINAISSAARALISHHAEAQQGVIDTLYTEGSEYEGVPLTRILEIVEAFENAPPTAPSSRANGDHATGVATPHEAAPRIAATNSFSFMQADELEATQEPLVTKTEPEPESAPNGTPVEEAEPTEEVEEAGPNQDNINWADDEGGLPSLSGLQEKFGASGSATPAEASTPVISAVEPTPDDGFTQARGRGHRGGGRGGHRGRGGDGHRGDRSRRGSFRGRGDGERGPHRRHEGGERGSYRGRGEGGERRGGRGGGERGGRGRGDRNRGAPPATA